MTLLLEILAGIALAEVIMYLGFLIRREKREQKEYEAAKLAHIEDSVPPTQWT